MAKATSLFVLTVETQGAFIVIARLNTLEGRIVAKLVFGLQDFGLKRSTIGEIVSAAGAQNELI